jgi:hypothetical protein
VVSVALPDAREVDDVVSDTSEDGSRSPPPRALRFAAKPVRELTKTGKDIERTDSSGRE